MLGCVCGGGQLSSAGHFIWVTIWAERDGKLQTNWFGAPKAHVHSILFASPHPHPPPPQPPFSGRLVGQQPLALVSLFLFDKFCTHTQVCVQYSFVLTRALKCLYVNICKCAILYVWSICFASVDATGRLLFRVKAARVYGCNGIFNCTNNRISSYCNSIVLQMMTDSVEYEISIG